MPASFGERDGARVRRRLPNRCRPGPAFALGCCSWRRRCRSCSRAAAFLLFDDVAASPLARAAPRAPRRSRADRPSRCRDRVASVVVGAERVRQPPRMRRDHGDEKDDQLESDEEPAARRARAATRRRHRRQDVVAREHDRHRGTPSMNSSQGQKPGRLVPIGKDDDEPWRHPPVPRRTPASPIRSANRCPTSYWAARRRPGEGEEAGAEADDEALAGRRRSAGPRAVGAGATARPESSPWPWKAAPTSPSPPGRRSTPSPDPPCSSSAPRGAATAGRRSR